MPFMKILSETKNAHLGGLALDMCENMQNVSNNAGKNAH
jgi:hypothetical protein